MKWFKHMTGTFDDEKIARYVELCGLEGYGFFWRIIELIAAQVEKDNEKCDVTYSLPTLSRLCYSHHNKVGKLLVTLGVTGLMTISKSEVAGVVSFSIKCPNVLKYRDEWTARKGKTPEQLPSNSRATPELNRTDKDKDKDKDKDVIAAPDKKSGTAKPKKLFLVDDETVERLSNDPAYEGIDVKKESLRAQSWLRENPKGRGRPFSKKFFLNWLLRADNEEPQSGKVDAMDILRKMCAEEEN